MFSRFTYFSLANILLISNAAQADWGLNVLGRQSWDNSSYTSIYNDTYNIDRSTHFYVDTKPIEQKLAEIRTEIERAGTKISQSIDTLTISPQERERLTKYYHLEKYGPIIGIDIDSAEITGLVREKGLHALQLVIEDRLKYKSILLALGNEVASALMKNPRANSLAGLEESSKSNEKIHEQINFQALLRLIDVRLRNSSLKTSVVVKTADDSSLWKSNVKASDENSTAAKSFITMALERAIERGMNFDSFKKLSDIYDPKTDKENPKGMEQVLKQTELFHEELTKALWNDQGVASDIRSKLALYQRDHEITAHKSKSDSYPFETKLNNLIDHEEDFSLASFNFKRDAANTDLEAKMNGNYETGLEVTFQDESNRWNREQKNFVAKLAVEYEDYNPRNKDNRNWRYQNNEWTDNYYALDGSKNRRSGDKRLYIARQKGLNEYLSKITIDLNNSKSRLQTEENRYWINRDDKWIERLKKEVADLEIVKASVENTLPKLVEFQKKIQANIATQKEEIEKNFPEALFSKIPKLANTFADKLIESLNLTTDTTLISVKDFQKLADAAENLKVPEELEGAEIREFRSLVLQKLKNETFRLHGQQHAVLYAQDEAEKFYAQAKAGLEISRKQNLAGRTVDATNVQASLVPSHELTEDEIIKLAEIKPLVGPYSCER
ncbi:MAG: hypothetical protein J0L93_09600 [Deltaproteobacteria bacterium]|nr:hypothetical protein [Deltaproteobacteria bacterium]